VVFFIPSDDVKFAFVVSKKVGNAVTRNRVKRRLRAIVRKSSIDKGWFLILAKPSIKEAKFSELQVNLTKCLLQFK
jgi:ribonuclease P protein component